MSRAVHARKNLLQYTVERMTEHDLLDVVNIEETCGLSLWGWEGYYTELERQEAVMLIAASISVKSAVRKKIYGFIAARINLDELHINNIGVRQEMRGCGIGSRLLTEALSIGARRGAGRAVLEVRANNQLAILLYESHSFKVSGRRRNYYKNPSEDALVMVAQLGR